MHPPATITIAPTSEKTDLWSISNDLYFRIAPTDLEVKFKSGDVTAKTGSSSDWQSCSRLYQSIRLKILPEDGLQEKQGVLCLETMKCILAQLEKEMHRTKEVFKKCRPEDLDRLRDIQVGAEVSRFALMIGKEVSIKDNYDDMYRGKLVKLDHDGPYQKAIHMHFFLQTREGSKLVPVEIVHIGGRVTMEEISWFSWFFRLWNWF